MSEENLLSENSHKYVSMKKHTVYVTHPTRFFNERQNKLSKQRKKYASLKKTL